MSEPSPAFDSTSGAQATFTITHCDERFAKTFYGASSERLYTLTICHDRPSWFRHPRARWHWNRTRGRKTESVQVTIPDARVTVIQP